MKRIHSEPIRVARRGTSREINRQIVLNLVRARQPVSRADLARLMGTRRGAISLIVNDLIAEGLLFEGAKGETAARAASPSSSTSTRASGRSSPSTSGPRGPTSW